MRVAQEAVTATGAATSTLDCTGHIAVFASSHGDAGVTDKICRSLTLAERQVSPTDFHNAVHNAPAGYWSIGTRSRTASTSVSLQDGTFAAGLLEAITIACVEIAPVLLVACDLPLPHPLSASEKVSAPFAVAFVLTPARDAKQSPRLLTSLRAGVGEDRLADPELENLRLGNPVARSLPLLRCLAQASSAAEQIVVLPYLAETRLEIQITA
jgi:hypothetical protein